MTDATRRIFGIDKDRYRGYDTNKPEEIFDFIEKDIAAMCEKGAPIKLIIIDSITDVMGRRMANASTVSTQQMGDDAATIKDGLKRIKTVLRRYGITLLMVAQERAVLDPVEVMRGKKTKMAGAFYLQHFSEYFVYVAKNEAKEGKTDMSGNKFEVAGLQDVDGNSETVAHKIKVKMMDSSVGVARRVGEFTFNKYKGIVNIHEEAFRLAVARSIVERPNNRTYILPNWPVEGEQSSWTSREDFLTNLNANPDIIKEITKRVKLKDIDAVKNGLTDQDFNAGELEEAGDPLESLSED
jgi:hypothetical protein